jgi:uncharacterized membrane protein
MMLWSMIMIIVFLISAIVFAITVFMVKKKRNEGRDMSERPDYRAFFILGITFLPMGLIMSITVENPGFYGITAMGTIFFLIGISHKDEWKS